MHGSTAIRPATYFNDENTGSKITLEMESWRSRLSTVFLQAGFHVVVSLVTDRVPGGLSAPYPSLVISGRLTRGMIKEILSETGIVEDARRVGISSIDFETRAGHWIFDLTAIGRTCARDVCL